MNPPKLLVALRPLEIKQLFDFAIRIYRQRFPAMFLAMAMVQLPLSLLGIVVVLKLVIVMAELQQMTSTGSEPGMDWLLQHVDTAVMLAVVMLVAAAYQLVITPFGTLACARLGVRALHGESPSLGECLHYTLKRYWPTQVALATFVLPLLVLAVLTLILVLIGQATGSEAAIISGVIIGFALILLGAVATFLLYFRLFPALAGIIQSAEELPPGGMGSQGVWLLRRAWELTTGQYWRMLGLIVLAWFAIKTISRGISESVNYLVFLFVEIIRGTQGEDILTNMMFGSPDPLGMGITMTIATLITLIFPPFIMCYQLLLYYDLRCRKEAYDLELLLETAPLPPED
jgi:hypothetical protein